MFPLTSLGLALLLPLHSPIQPSPCAVLLHSEALGMVVASTALLSPIELAPFGLAEAENVRSNHTVDFSS